MGFFDKHATNKPRCISCGLDKRCKHPRTKYTGEGGKRILIIAEAPGEEEDEQGVQLIGKPGQKLRKELFNIGINLDKDCWKINAIGCRVTDSNGDSASPTSSHIDSCRPYLMGVIKELKPAKIILLGNVALESFYNNRIDNKAITKFSGLQFWDSVHNAWVFPLYHPSYVLKKEYDRGLNAYFVRTLKEAINFDATPLNKTWNPVRLLVNFDHAVRYLSDIIKNHKMVSLDWETTGLKSQPEGHKIASVGLANDEGAVSIPVQHPHWTEEQQRKIKFLLANLMKNRKCKKIVHSFGYEYAWSKNVLGVEPLGIIFDTQLGVHIEDNRQGITGLKFQAFMRWGISGYENAVEPFLKAKEGIFNNVFKAPLDLLLQYNGEDALYTWEIYKELQEKFDADDRRAYKILHDGMQVLCEMHCNGIKIRKQYYMREKKRLEGVREDILEDIRKLDDVISFHRKYGRPFDMNSNNDMQDILFTVMGIKPTKETKTGFSVDEDVLEKINTPLTKLVLKVRKISKQISTYIDGFMRESFNGIMYPWFYLDRARTYRSSSANPNFQNIPKRDFEAMATVRSGIVPFPGELLGEADFSGAEVSTSCVTGDTLIETIDGPMPIRYLCRLLDKKEMYVYGYNRSLGRIGIAKVTAGGVTGRNKKTLKVTLDSGESVKATPDHKFMLRNGEYIEASALKPGDSLMPLYKKRRGKGVFYSDIYLNNGDHILAHNLIAKDVYAVDICGNSGLVVHHKDGNGLNNSLNNLQIMSRREHMRIHSIQGWKNKPQKDRPEHHAKSNKFKKYMSALNKQRKESWGEKEWEEFRNRVKEGIQTKNGGNKGRFNPMFGKVLSTEHKLAISRKNKGKQAWSKGLKLSPLSMERKEKIGKAMKGIPCPQRGVKGRVFSEEHKNNLKGPKTENHRENISKAKKAYWETKQLETCHICKREFRSVTNTHLQSHGISIQEYKGLHNHTVVSVEICGYEDVYNINVEGIHNYATSAGVIVKNCFYHKDPNFIRYQKNKDKADMHKDAASEIWKVDRGLVSKPIRQDTKGGFVFAEFYGGYYVDCATLMWETMLDHKLADGTPLSEHIKKVGLDTYSKFEKHVQKFEHKFWDEWFPGYKQWKKDIHEEYIKTGMVKTLLGFKFRGYMDRKQCSNYPVQGTSFHLLLYTLTKLSQRIKKEGKLTRLVGQIHDSIVASIMPEELEWFKETVAEIVRGLDSVFTWMTVPMDIELEISDTYEEGGSFAKLKKAAI